MNEDILKKTCCFTGHRDISKIKAMELKLKLPKIIEKLITEKGVIYFGVGGALGFDMLAEKAVLKLKKKYPFIKLILVLPCKNHNKNWKIADKLELNFIAKQADKISYIQGQNGQEYTESFLLLHLHYNPQIYGLHHEVYI